PLGQRVRPTESSTSGRSGSGRSGSGQADPQSPRPNRPDSPTDKRSAQAVTDDDGVDWDTYRPPSQWEEWGQRPDPTVAEPVTAQQGFSFRQRPPFSQRPQGPDTVPDTALDDIAAGWEGYDSAQYDSVGYDSAQYDSAGYDSTGYDSAQYDSTYQQQGYGSQEYCHEYGPTYPDPYPDLASDRPGSPEPRIYPDGYLYGPEETDQPSNTLREPGTKTDSEEVYDADFRVIIPPYSPDRDRPDRDRPDRDGTSNRG
ncbi:MAG: hypothetical protein AAFZ80_10960, partial [Cyanobacteria bacterium P01_A01_bin.105]